MPAMALRVNFEVGMLFDDAIGYSPET